jgi:hypothetical protein
MLVACTALAAPGYAQVVVRERGVDPRVDYEGLTRYPHHHTDVRETRSVSIAKHHPTDDIHAPPKNDVPVQQFHWRAR